jgi:hypothetical protein
LNVQIHSAKKSRTGGAVRFFPQTRIAAILALFAACFVLMLGQDTAHAAPIASEEFYYPHGMVLSNGLAAGGSGWSNCWEQTTGDGLTVRGAQVNQGASGESTRALAAPFELNGSAVYYVACLARATESGAFAIQLKQTSGDFVRWQFARHADGCISVQAGGTTTNSPAGLFKAGREYLVVSKFETSGDIARVKLFDSTRPGDYTTEPTTWDLVADGNTGVTIDRLDLDVDAGQVTIDDIRIATTYAEVIPALTPVDTFVLEVDRPSTTGTKQWTYTVAEAGNYQIGLAWVETQSGGDVAVEIFKNGLERIKGLYAPAGEVTRFETRIDALNPGDEITVKLTPNGSTYRAGYQMAFCTPRFDGLPIFDVASYGAVGDGVTDDMAAIHAALTAARHAGGGIVRFDGTKTYRPTGLTNATVECLLDLYGARNIKIEGNGATILLHPPDSFAELYYCENVQIDGFKIDYDPLPYYQGTITDINVANLTIDIDVPERYPEPLVGAIADQDPTKLGPFFGRSFIPSFPGARSGRGDNIYVTSTALNGSPRKVRIQVPATVGSASMTPRVQAAYDNNATEFVVPHLLYGQRNGQTKIYNCSRVTFSNLHYVCMSYFWLGIQHNTGPITLSNVDLKMTEPETELLASWRDGMHIKNGRWGILIEDGDWDGAAQYDDTFAIYSRRQVMVSSSANTAALKPSVYNRESWLWQPGDWASFWTSDQAVLRGMARVVSVQNLTAPNYEVTFESLPAGVAAGDVVLHEESLNRGTLVRNCTTSDIGTEDASTRLRGTDMRFENNHFEDFTFLLEWGNSFGTPRVRDLVVKNTYFSSPDGYLKLSRPLGALFKGCVFDGLAPIVEQGADNVYFDGNTWTNMTGNILSVGGASRAWLFGNSTRNGSAAGLSSYVTKDGSSTVTYEAPAGYPAPTPPNPSDVSHLIESDADSYVRDGAPNVNFGTNTYMRCKDDPGGNFSRWSYLRFALPNVRGTVERVVLRLKVVGVTGSGGTHTAYRVNDSWDETTITWSNRPALGIPLASAAYAEVDDWTEFDITDAFDSDDAQLSVAVVSDGSALVNYASRESGPDAPQLVVGSQSPGFLGALFMFR